MRIAIRRSIAVAATATGLLALGAVSANAAELPATSDLPAVGSLANAGKKVQDTVPALPAEKGLPAGLSKVAKKVPHTIPAQHGVPAGLSKAAKKAPRSIPAMHGVPAASD
ncbi:hypothetical protein FNZ23_26610, partial [Streptomyces benahoarensis]